MTKASELREMSDEQLGFTLKESAESLFRLRIKAQTERLNAPSELRKARRTIARVRTIQTERALAAAAGTTTTRGAVATRGTALPKAAAKAKNRTAGDQVMPKRVEIGVVKTDKMAKTRRVEIPRQVRHAKYGKILHRKTVCHVHDEQNESHVGDTVEIVESRPRSKTKRWELVRDRDQEPAGRPGRNAGRLETRPRRAPVTHGSHPGHDGPVGRPSTSEIPRYP